MCVFVCVFVCHLAISWEKPCLYITLQYLLFSLLSFLIQSSFLFRLFVNVFRVLLGVNFISLTWTITLFNFIILDIFMTLLLTQTYVQLFTMYHRYPYTPDIRAKNAHTYTHLLLHAQFHIREVDFSYIHKHTLPLCPMYPLASLTWPRKDTEILGQRQKVREKATIRKVDFSLHQWTHTNRTSSASNTSHFHPIDF